MSSLQTFRVLGISSGSALDGIDASIIITDGVDVFDICPHGSIDASLY